MMTLERMTKSMKKRKRKKKKRRMMMKTKIKFC